MSEVKGTLLSVILALSAFGIVFGLIVGAIKSSATTVAGNIDSSTNPQLVESNSGEGD